MKKFAFCKREANNMKIWFASPGLIYFCCQADMYFPGSGVKRTALFSKFTKIPGCI
jgi:hypothetical protein